MIEILIFICIAVAAFSLGFVVCLFCFERPIKQTPQAQIIHKNKPGGIFKEDIPSGPVQRPDAQMIAKWNEDPKIKAQKEALKETFDADPQLQALKKEYEQTAKY